MMNLYSRPGLNQFLCQSLLVGALAAIGLLSGLTPGLSKDSHTLVFSSSAYAQGISDDELRRYVRASMRIERLRLVVYDEIKRINRGNVPDIASCSSQGLPSNIAPIWQRFCAQSEQVIKGEGFSNSRYNAITKMRQEDPDLERRVREILQRQG
jgi:hypothetical protein